MIGGEVNQLIKEANPETKILQNLGENLQAEKVEPPRKNQENLQLLITNDHKNAKFQRRNEASQALNQEKKEGLQAKANPATNGNNPKTDKIPPLKTQGRIKLK